MDARAWKTVGKGLAIATVYCAAFLVLWHYSYDQWYLPAGLRLAGLLLLPTRYWPYVFAGDAAALLVMRAPKAEQYSQQWAYLSPFVFMPIYSLVPYLFRRRWRDRETLMQWLPVLAVAVAVWTTVVGRATNVLLGGPAPAFTAERFFSFCIGDILGILMFLLPCLLWDRRHHWKNSRENIAQSLAIATLMIVVFFAIAMVPSASGSPVRLMPLIFMMAPLVYLTALHGWYGAATGTILVNVAIALALPHIDIIGASDSLVLIAQAAFAAISSGLLVIGVRISNLFQQSGSILRDEWVTLQIEREKEREAKTMGAVRAMFQSFEQRFREKALLLAYARDDLDAYRNAVAQTLKDEGLYRQAMDALSSGVESARALVRHSELLYPFEIETYGLYAVLTSDAFAERWKGRARLRLVLVGRSPSRLSIPLQLAAYRAICSAMDVLAGMAPTEVTIQTRGWYRRGRRGITIFVECIPTTTVVHGSETDSLLQELEVLARAYGGTVKHRQTHRIGLLISESDPAS